MSKKWIQRKPKKRTRIEDSVIDYIAGVRGIDDIDRFLSPAEDVLHDPHKMKNIVRASKRIKKAIENDEDIVVSMDCK